MDALSLARGGTIRSQSIGNCEIRVGRDTGSMLRPLCEWKTKPRPLLVGRSTPDEITDSKAFVLELAAKRYQEMDQASKAGDAFLNAGKMIRSLCLGVGDVETYLELQTKDIANRVAYSIWRSRLSKMQVMTQRQKLLPTNWKNSKPH